MPAQGGPLAFQATLTRADFEAGITAMERRIMGVSGVAVREGQKIDSVFSNLGKAAAGYFAFDTFKDLALQMVKVRGEVQQLEIAFETMLGSKAKADVLLAGAVDLAAKTPFELKEVAAGAKQLLAYGSSASTVLKEVSMLGDVAAGVSAPLGDLVYLYGTLRSQGRAYTVDIRQFAGRGIPIYAELAKVLGVSVDKVNDLVSAGKVGFPQVEQAFANMTSAGGKFDNLMQKQSASLTGILSNLKDEIYQATNEIGESNQGMIADVLKGTITVVKNYEPILDILKTLVIAYGTYRAALLLTSAIQAASAIGAQVGVWLSLAKGIRSAADAQALLNLTTKANPYVLVASSLLALIAIISIYTDDLTAAEKAERSLKDARNKANETAQEEVAKIELLQVAINNENLSRAEREKNLKNLIAISPKYLSNLTLENIKTSEGTQAIDAYVEALKRKIEQQELDAKLTESLKRQIAAENDATDFSTVEKVGQALMSKNEGGPDGYENGLAKQRKAANAQIIADEKVNQARLKNAKKTNDELAAESEKAATKTGKATVKTIKFYDDQIKSLQTEKEGSSTRKQADAIQKQIDAAVRARNRISGEQTADEKKATKAAAKDADKAGAMGSIAYYEQVAAKADEIISKTAAGNTAAIQAQIAIRDAAKEQAELIRRSQEMQVGTLEYYESMVSAANKVLTQTPVSDTAAIETQQYIIQQATERAEELRKVTAVRSFNEELDEKKRQYEQYQLFIDALGQEAADAQFAELKKSGDTYVDYLNKQIAQLQLQQVFGGGLDKKQGEKLVTLTAERDDATGAKKKIDLFSEGLAKARLEAGSLTDYLNVLKQKQAELGKTATAYNLQAGLLLAQEIVQTQTDRTAQLKEFIANVAGSEEQRLAITKKYADLRAEVERQATPGNQEQTSARLAAITKQQNAEIEAVKISTAEQSDAYKELTKVIDVEGRRATQVRIQRLKAYLAVLAAAGLTETQLFKQVTLDLRTETRNLEQDTLNTINELAGLGGQLGSTFSALGGVMGGVGDALAGIAGGVGNITKALDSDASTLDKVSAGINGLIGLADVLISSAAQRKQAEAEALASSIALQNQYNIALNDQIGLQSQLAENVFVKDQEGRLRDGVKQLGAANMEYQKSIAQLSQGRAKNGQSDGIDWGKVGKGAASGAAIGAFAGPIGAAVGGFIGGVIGLFGGKKKEDDFAGLLDKYPDLIKGGANGWAEVNKELATALISQNQVDEATKQLLQTTLDWQAQIEKARAQIKQVISEVAGGLGNSLRDSLVNAFTEGLDSAQAFGDGVSKVLEDLLSQLIFNQIFGKQFDQLQAQMEASYGANGDQSWVDDITRFYETAGPLTDQFNEALKVAQEAAGKNGLNVFTKKDATANTNKTALSGAIKSVSEETASVLAGQLNAIRISQAQGNVDVRQAVLHLGNIDMNTATMALKLDKLDKIYDVLKSDPLRAKGQPG